jgi:hypothetical protein
MDGLTEGKRRQQERNRAIVALLDGYSGSPWAPCVALAQDWDEYTRRSWTGDKADPGRLAKALPLRLALYTLTKITDGHALSAKQIDRIKTPMSISAQ